MHRVDGATDIYFVRNKGARAIDAVPLFRVVGRTPEIWNAVDGTIAPQMYYTVESGQTGVPLHLDAYGSVFVVFARSESKHVMRVIKDSKEVESVEVRGNDRDGFVLEHADAGGYRLELSDRTASSGDRTS